MRKGKWKKPLNTFLSIGLVASLVVPVFPLTSNAATTSSDLLISEYVEGSSFNKALELYNGSGAAIDLSNYSLELYANGATAATSTLALSGTLASEKTYVLVHKDASAAVKSKGQLENASVINFNGDDAIVLKKSGAVIDSFGQVGARSNWGTDVTLVRKDAVTAGDSNPKDTFNRDAEWIVYPKDTFDYLGFHDVDSSIVKPVSANPAGGTFVGSTTVTLSTTTTNAEILYTVDGTDPIKNGVKYDRPINITSDTTLKAVVKTSKGQVSDVRTFAYTITESLQIHDIQGAGHTSPFDNQTVEGIEGIVTYSFTLSGSTYYHIQTPDALADDNPNTSEGIILYSGRNAWPIQVGDLVSVTGKVSEYAIDGFADRQQTDMKVTQINVRDDQGGKVVVLKRGVTLPEPIIIDKNNVPTEHIDSDGLRLFNPKVDAIDFWESLEGMRVKVGNVKAVSPQEHGDLITVLDSDPTNTLHGGLLLEKDNQNANRVQFRLEPNGPARDFEVATGDTFKGPITGVVGYSFQNYKIYVPLDKMQAAHAKGSATPEKTTIVKQDDKLTIASYNLENFSNNTKSSSADKARKLARAFAQDMRSPDIVGVTEVQDNNGEDAGDSKANESYERLIAEIVKAGGVHYEYVNIDPVNNQDGGAPNANIRVGFLYNPERVKLTKGIPQGDATTAVGYKNGKLTHNPGRIDPNNSAFTSSRKPLAAQFDFQGESVIVIANHWNSKSGDTPLFGSTQPPVYGSEIQRKKMATIVYNFIADVKTKNPEANVVSVGDFNDFQFSESLKIHEGKLMTNMINKVEKADRYTYLYQGNSQVLDHILVSNHLVDQTEIDILHINADFTDMAGRASDHDPVLVQIGFKAPVVWKPIPVKKVYDLVNYKKKKLNIAEPSVAVKMDAKSYLTEGVLLKGDYAELSGEGFKTNKVILQPKKKGLVVDMKGTVMGDVIVDGSHKLQIRGAENIRKIEFINGAKQDAVEFYNSKGKRIGVPTVKENKAPVIKKKSRIKSEGRGDKGRKASYKP